MAFLTYADAVRGRDSRNVTPHVTFDQAVQVSNVSAFMPQRDLHHGSNSSGSHPAEHQSNWVMVQKKKKKPKGARLDSAALNRSAQQAQRDRNSPHPSPQHGRNMRGPSRTPSNVSSTHRPVMTRNASVPNVVDRSQTPYQFEPQVGRTWNRFKKPSPKIGTPVTTATKAPVEHVHKGGPFAMHIDCQCVDCLACTVLCNAVAQLAPHTNIVVKRVIDVVKSFPTPDKLRTYVKDVEKYKSILYQEKYDSMSINHTHPDLCSHHRRELKAKFEHLQAHKRMLRAKMQPSNKQVLRAKRTHCRSHINSTHYPVVDFRNYYDEYHEEMNYRHRPYVHDRVSHYDRSPCRCRSCNHPYGGGHEFEAFAVDTEETTDNNNGNTFTMRPLTNIFVNPITGTQTRGGQLRRMIQAVSTPVVTAVSQSLQQYTAAPLVTDVPYVAEPNTATVTERVTTIPEAPPDSPQPQLHPSPVTLFPPVDDNMSIPSLVGSPSVVVPPANTAPISNQATPPSSVPPDVTIHPATQPISNVATERKSKKSSKKEKKSKKKKTSGKSSRKTPSTIDPNSTDPYANVAGDNNQPADIGTRRSVTIQVDNNGGDDGDDSSSDDSSSSSSSSSSDSSSSELLGAQLPTARSPVASTTIVDALYDDEFFAQRQQYVVSIRPSDNKEMKKADTKSAKLYKDLYKIGDKISKLSQCYDQTERAKVYRAFKTDLHNVLLQNRYTSQLIDRYGVVNIQAQLPWYALKGAAQFITSKLSPKMVVVIKHMDPTDPIALLVRLDDYCLDMTPALRRQLTFQIQNQKIKSNETASMFITRMQNHFDEAYSHHITFSEREKVDIVIEGLRPDKNYENFVHTFTTRRAEEDRVHLGDHPSCLSIQTMERQLNAHDRIVGLNKKHSANPTANTSSSSNTQRRSRHFVNKHTIYRFRTPVAEVAAVQVASQKSHKKKKAVVCFKCAGNHSVAVCPHATEEDKTRLFEEFRIKQQQRRDLSPADKTVVSNNKTHKTHYVQQKRSGTSKDKSYAWTQEAHFVDAHDDDDYMFTYVPPAQDDPSDSSSSGLFDTDDSSEDSIRYTVTAVSNHRSPPPFIFHTLSHSDGMDFDTDADSDDECAMYASTDNFRPIDLAVDSQAPADSPDIRSASTPPPHPHTPTSTSSQVSPRSPEYSPTSPCYSSPDTVCSTAIFTQVCTNIPTTAPASTTVAPTLAPPLPFLPLLPPSIPSILRPTSYSSPIYVDFDQPFDVDDTDDENESAMHAAFAVDAFAMEEPSLPAPICTKSFRGIPPVHRDILGEQPHKFWLIDSGTTSHMTPFMSDLDPGSFVHSRSSVRVANNHRSQSIGSGTVTLTIRNYLDDTTVYFQLTNVLVVPSLHKRLISTDELNEFHHEIRLPPLYVGLYLKEINPTTGVSSTTIIKLPRYYEYDERLHTLVWPADQLRAALDTDPDCIVAAPINLRRKRMFAERSLLHFSSQTTSIDDTDAALDDTHTITPTALPKRHVPMSLLHHRIGHRSYEAIKRADAGNIWNDVKVINDPEPICQTCHITNARLANRNRTSPTYPVRSGVMVFIDLIKNPFEVGLTLRSHFNYYLLIVDAYSHLPVLLGLDVVTANEVFRLITVFQTMFRPSLEENIHPEVNAQSLQHIKTDAGSQFTSAEFIQKCLDASINITFAAPKHQEMNGLCERTWQSLRSLAFSFMNYARVGLEFGDMALEHAWKVMAVLPLKNIDKDGALTTPFELYYRRKPSLRKFRVLFCPCVYKVHEREKRVSSKVIQRYNSKNHPQRGVIGIFIGFPRSHAGYLIWEPRSKTIRFSLDVSFDEQFLSVGPRRHFAFKDALPVNVMSDVPNIHHFQNSIPLDDHYGVPQQAYHEDHISDGFHIISTDAINELYDDLSDPSSVEESSPSFGNDGIINTPPSPSIDDTPITSVLDESPIASSGPASIQTINPPDTEFEVTADEYIDPLVIIRPGKRTIRKKIIYDPSDIAAYAEPILNRVTMDQFHTVTHQAMTVQNNIDDDKTDGMDPAAFLPEPQSLKGMRYLPPDVLKQWLKAFRSELNNHIEKTTFAIPSEYKGEKCLPVTVIYKTKLRSDGLVDKLKVRIAIRGDLDEAAQDEDNGAPLATFRLLKVFLADAAKKRRRVYQSDFVGAYLQAYMDRIVYVKLPKEWAEYFPDLAKWFGVPLLLIKSAYGINSAGRLWAEELFNWYTEFGFKQSQVEPSLFQYTVGDDWIVLLSYCDDSAYYCSSDAMRQKFESAMCKRFDCKLLGQLHWFLKARITQHSNFDITIDQARYCASICTKFLPTYSVSDISDQDALKYASMLPSEFVFTKQDNSASYFELRDLEDEYGFRYPVAIGCLIWILNTYPRLQFPIRKLAKFMRLPGRNHFKALLHLLHHIRCNHTVGITYYSDVLDSPLARLLHANNLNPMHAVFVAFGDSSWQDCVDSGRSTGAYHIFNQGGIVDSAMTFPVPVALSSAEAEYNNACDACVAINALAMLYNELQGCDPDMPLHIPLLLDNTASIAMGDSFKDSKHTRHILRRYHYVRWMSSENRVNLLWIPTDAQLADPATKCIAASEPTFIAFRRVAETQVKL